MEEATAKRDITAASIDLGSNTFRLLIAEISGDRTSLLLKRNITVRLSQGISAGGTLRSEAIDRALGALREFAKEIGQYRPECYRCCGTEALRRADNVEEFLIKASEIIGTEIEIIDGTEEAYLSCRGVLDYLGGRSPGYPILIIDVGGASTELVYLEDPSNMPAATSLSAGAVAFTEIKERGDLQESLDALCGNLKEFLDCLEQRPKINTVIATGGTATTMAMLDLALNRYDAEKVQGHGLSVPAIDKLHQKLATMAPETRKFLPGLEEGRGDIILAGIEIYQEVLATIGVGGMIVSDTGLLEGIMISCLEQKKA